MSSISAKAPAGQRALAPQQAIGLCKHRTEIDPPAVRIDQRPGGDVGCELRRRHPRSHPAAEPARLYVASFRTVDWELYVATMVLPPPGRAAAASAVEQRAAVEHRSAGDFRVAYSRTSGGSTR